jgi:hypothetical protein
VNVVVTPDLWLIRHGETDGPCPAGTLV